jgi:putative ABC transport system substrate-binding protein
MMQRSRGHAIRASQNHAVTDPRAHRISRRDILSWIGAVAVFAAPAAAIAEADRVYRLGILETIPAERNAANLAALRRGLRERGYVEGRNLAIEYRSAGGRADRFPALAAELTGLPVDLIVTRGTPAAKAAKAATATIPIVMAAIGEPLGMGVVASLARPGGNVTGLSAYVTELAGKRVELTKEAFPSISRIGFLQDMGNPVASPQWEATRTAAAALSLGAELIDIRTQDSIAEAFATLAERKIDALSVGIDALTQENAKAIVTLAETHKILTGYPSREFVDIGGLLSYGPSYPDLYYRAAGLIDKILKGAKPGDLPVEQPVQLELVVNLKTARAFGVTIPPATMARADDVVE